MEDEISLRSSETHISRLYLLVQEELAGGFNITVANVV